MSHPQCTVVVPCYNEEGAIADTVNLLCNLPNVDAFYNVIVVNDGSTDKTSQALGELKDRYSNLRVLTHPRNRGYGAALKTGIRHADTELIAITDADGTYPNDRLPELIERCKNHDMVVGARIGRDVTYSRLRAIPKMFLRAWISWLSGVSVPDINSGMRVFRKDIAEQFFGILPDTFSFTITITIAMLTNYRSVEFISINYTSRIGRSKIRPIRDTLRFIVLVLRTGIYFAPLRAFTPLLLFLLSGAMASLFYDILLLRNLTDKTILLFLFAMNVGMFALLADMIDKRTSR